jgi:hypothetical protein
VWQAPANLGTSLPPLSPRFKDNDAINQESS